MPMNREVMLRQISSWDNGIGFYHQGKTTDYFFETDQCGEILSMLDLYRQLGIPVGIGTHLPEVIEKSENEEWNVDFYLGCMQNARRDRKGEKSGFLSGKTKAGLVFSPEDRPVMLNQMKKVDKPVVAFEIFAGGQMFSGKTEEEKRTTVKNVYEEVFTALKPNDFAAIGVFQRDKDQITENAELYNEWYKEKYGEEK